MKSKAAVKRQKRMRRKASIRKNLSGTAEIPRVYVFRSNRYIYVSAADDTSHKVLGTKRAGKGVDKALQLGKDFGKWLKEQKIERVVYDRSGYKYHGQVKAIADGLREAGVRV